MARTIRIAPLALILAACGTQSSPDAGTHVDAGSSVDAGPANIETMGAWDDNYGNSDLGCASDAGVPSWCYWAINNTLWGEDTVVSYDNSTRSCVTQEYAFSQYNPNSYNKLFWAPADGGFWWCNAAYDQATYDDALNSSIQVDSTDPATGGCPLYADGGGFSWTYMSPHRPDIAIAGAYHGADGAPLVVTDTSWGTDSIVWYENPASVDAGWAVTKTTSAMGAATYNAILWSTSSAPSECVLSSGLESAEKAEEAIASGDDTGCTLSALTKE